jgi:DNA-binding CsgD family transcriptional regulator
MPPSKSAAHFGLPKHLQNSLPLSAIHPLSPREAEVLFWISDGKRDREIAIILGISWRTVEKHVQKILKKLGVETRTGASKWWHERIRAIERVTMPPAARN